MPKDRGEEFAHQLGAMFTETSAAENMGEWEGGGREGGTEGGRDRGRDI